MPSRYLIDIILSTVKKGTGGEDLNKELKGVDTVTEKLKANWTKFAAVGASVVGAAMAVQKAFEFGREGAVITQTADSFDGLIDRLGATPSLLEDLRTASRNTVDDMTLMSSTTTLLAGTQGVLATELANATPQLMNIAKAANKLNPTLGDTTFLYESLATGIKRSSPMILDNLGLTIRLGAANEAMAKEMGKAVEELTAEEKQMALLKETLQAGNIMLEQVGDSTESATDAYDALGTTVKNLTDELKSAAEPAVRAIVDVINEWADIALKADDRVRALADSTRDNVSSYDAFIEAVLKAAVSEKQLNEAGAAALRQHLRFGASLDETDPKLGRFAGSTQRVVESLGLMTRAEYEAVNASEEAISAAEQLGAGYDDYHQRLSNVTEALYVNVDATTKSSSAELGLKDAVTKTAFFIDEEGNALDIVAERKKAAEQASKDLAKAEDALADAVGRVMERYEGFYSTLAEGIVSFRDLGAAQDQAAADYESSLADLEAKQRGVTSGMKMNWEASLPDKTSVAERLGMAGDAWDEWGLRLQDIINQGVASPWFATLQQMGMEKPPDVGVKEWAADLQKAFYLGEVPDLLPPEWAQNVRDQQAEATAAFQVEAGKRRAAVQEEIDTLNAAREAQLEAEREQRNQATIELALSLAEQTGQLQDWSEQEFGPEFGQVADSASEVMGLLESGMLAVDGSLETLLQNMTGGIQTMLDTTGAAAEENKAKLQEIAEFDPTAEFEAQKQTILDAFDPEAIPVEDFKAQMAEVQTAYQQMMAPTGEEAMAEDPFGAMLLSFQGAQDAIIDGAGTLSDEVVDNLQNIDTEAETVADAVRGHFVGNSAFPDISAGAQEMGFITQAAFMTMQSVGVAAGDSVGTSWATGLQAAQTELKEMVKALKSLPDEIVITLTTEVTGGGVPDLQHGGQWTVRGRGGIDNVPVFFNATPGEVVTVTPRGQTAPGFQQGGQFTVPNVARTVYVSGDKHTWNIRDQGSVALAMRLVQSKRKERLNEFMGA